MEYLDLYEHRTTRFRIKCEKVNPSKDYRSSHLFNTVCFIQPTREYTERIFVLLVMDYRKISFSSSDYFSSISLKLAIIAIDIRH